MPTPRFLVPLAGCCLTLTAAAQNGRTMRLHAPVVLGQTAAVAIEHSPSLAGHSFALATCSPSFPGSLPFSLPGVVQGVLRLDPLAFGVLTVGVLDASGRSPVFTFPIPNVPQLVGATFDLQGADLDAGGTITLTDDELTIVVAAPPPATLDLVAIAPGTFSMGSSTFDAVEQPVHTVTISRPFWIGRYEVRQSDYAAVMGSNPAHFQFQPGSGNRPVEQVSWQAAVAYCDALTVQEAAAGRLPTGYEYRLPTEAEWEYCCRAGTTAEWSFGATPGCAQANLWLGFFYCVGQTSPVGSYPANAFGLRDLHGNVAEWCLDGWDGSANYPAGSVVDPFVASGPGRIARGGAWSTSTTGCRSAYRWLPIGASIAQNSVGFRIVCAPEL
ncbi:MAG: formylglycine-generating enzyme family protein [Planctomycetes bacterium]|nr:formylglycine-generating enzyme family protein [Planctomycetota bacterium]